MKGCHYFCFEQNEYANRAYLSANKLFQHLIPVLEINPNLPIYVKSIQDIYTVAHTLFQVNPVQLHFYPVMQATVATTFAESLK